MLKYLNKSKLRLSCNLKEGKKNGRESSPPGKYGAKNKIKRYKQIRIEKNEEKLKS